MLVLLWHRFESSSLLSGVLRKARNLPGRLVKSLLQLHVLLCGLELLEDEALQVFHTVGYLRKVVCRLLMQQMALLLVFQGFLGDEQVSIHCSLCLLEVDVLGILHQQLRLFDALDLVGEPIVQIAHG